MRADMSGQAVEWKEHGACRETTPKVMFPEDGGGVARAKLFCARCDVVEPCREYALASGVDYGVWGNMSERQRRHERRRRKIALAVQAEPAV